MKSIRKEMKQNHQAGKSGHRRAPAAKKSERERERRRGRERERERGRGRGRERERIHTCVYARPYVYARIFAPIYTRTHGYGQTRSKGMLTNTHVSVCARVCLGVSTVRVCLRVYT